MDAPVDHRLRDLLRRSLARVEELQRDVDHLRAGNARAWAEPIAVIGVGCRFPGGASGPAAYWDLLARGADAVGPYVERARSPGGTVDGVQSPAPGRRAGWLGPVDGFDTEFMAIAPREAARLDPQQRLALEVAWEALEDAAVAPDSLTGTDTGVFIGVSWQDYFHRISAQGGDEIDAHTLTGNMLSVTAGRIAYLLGLRGPAMSIDTACSSSLVAVHTAMRSLRSGESGLAIAGGVNLILSDLTTTGLDRMNALSPDGVCRTFDAGANGYVRGEGIGLLVLKRLRDALRDGDDVRAVLRGSAVNHDGRSLGLTAPNHTAQIELLRTALADAGLEPADISYLEAHGTGTLLGDPIEVEAAKVVLGAPRADGSVCALASVKTNIGHLEAAAGVAGLIKVVLALQNEQIPRHLHFTTLNPNIDLDGTAFVIPHAGLAWPRGERPRRAGVSSFGFAGTNAHVIVEEAPVGAAAPAASGGTFVLPVSARTPVALRQLSGRLADWLASAPEVPLADVCLTAGAGRAHFDHRAVVSGATRAELIDGLRAVAAGSPVPVPAAAAGYLDGSTVDWAGLAGPAARRRTGLPTYPFQRQRHWYGPDVVAVDEPYLSEHRLFGLPIAPAAYVALRAAAAAEAAELVDVVVSAPLPVGSPDVVVELGPRRPDGRPVRVASGRVTHLSAVARRDARPPGADVALASVRDRCRHQIAVDGFYADCAARGLDLGPAFRRITGLWRSDDGSEVLARIDPAGAVDLHPTLLDAAIQAALAVDGGVAARPGDGGTALVPFGIDNLRLGSGTAAWCHARRTAHSAEVLTCDVDLLSTGGTRVASLTGLRLTLATRAALRGSGDLRSDALFRLGWRQVDRRPRLPSASGRFVLVGQGPELAAALGRHATVEVDPAAIGGPDPLTVVYSGDTPSLLRLVQAVPDPGQARVIIVTRNAQRTGPDDAEPDPAAAALWGFGRSVQAERPGLGCRLIDVDAATGAERLAGELLADDGPSQVAVRAGGWHVPFLEPFHLPAGDPPALPAEGSYLVTGGLGALGIETARTLVRLGARTLVLVGRREPGDADRAAIADLEAAGSVVWYRRVDVADRGGVRRLLDEMATGLPPLRGVVHSAGVVDDGLLGELTADRLAGVMASKLDGGLVLDQATHGLPLDFFLLYSSVTGVLGSAGQCGYAAANSGLDALAGRRRARGLPATSIQWGPWAAGMVARLDERLRARWRARGFREIDVAGGMDVLAGIIAAAPEQVVVMPLDREALERAPRGLVPPLLAQLIAEPEDSVSVAAPAVAAPVAAVAAPAASAPVAAVGVPVAAVGVPVAATMALVRQHAAAVLGYTGPLPDRRPLRDLGLDSILAVELRNELAAATGRPLPATMLFDYPTVRQIAAFIDEQGPPAERAPIGIAAPAQPDAPQPDGPQPAAPDASPAVEPAAARTDRDPPGGREPIAIIGMACRYPGGVDTPEALWDLVAAGVDAITEVPPDRWNVDAIFNPDPLVEGTTYTRWGGFVRDVDRFDAQFFGISPGEATMMDPQQRMLLEVSWEALERAGQAPDRLTGRPTGIFVGVMSNDYAERVVRSGIPLDAWYGTGNLNSVASGRIAYLLGTQGPALTVDTACSSSLVTLHLAVNSLRSGECDLALAGGVTLLLTPTVNVYFSRARGVSASGRCSAFDAAADGVVWSEGCGMLVLKRLRDARRDGDRILAVVDGTAVNSDGRSQGISAPNGPAQQAVVRAALADAGIEAGDVDYVEAHGTGTLLGDPIEAQALGAVYGAVRTLDRPLWIGSVKSNMGHTQAAAGVANVIKVVQAFANETLPASIHHTRANPNVAWDRLPVRVVTEPLAWPRSVRSRRAGVSSFGISGTNAHAVLSEPAPAHATAPGPPPQAYLFTLSAHDEAALRRLADRYAGHLSAHPGLDLAAACRTANTGRATFGCRAAVVAANRAGVVAALRALATGADSADLCRGNAPGSGDPPPGPGPVTAADDRTAVLALAQWFVAGGTVDWAAFHAGPAGQPVLLPTYPFQRERYWIDEPSSMDGGAADELWYSLRWVPAALPAEPTPASGRWLVLADEPIVSALRGRGIDCVLVRDAADVDRALSGTGPPDAVVHVVPTDEGPDRLRRVLGGVMDLVRALARASRRPGRCWLVTRGAQAVRPGEDADAVQATVWGLARTVAAEHPELDCRVLDVDGSTVDAVAAALLAADAETQVAVRDGVRWAARVIRGASPDVLPLPAGPYRLNAPRGGDFDELALVPASPRGPGPGEVQIRVVATGLNLRDVLGVLGRYPGDPGAPGFECSGRIAAVGPGVGDLAVGDAVLALASGAFASHVTLDRRLVARIPDGMGFAAAATLPMAYVTAWYALFDLGGLRAGERVLVHAAAGGVGMAAVRLAQWAGADVLATASPHKWPAVRELGVRALWSSRSTDFAAGVRAHTGRAGVDLVLNSLAGEYVDRSLDLVAAGGRFVEMGKTDVRPAEAVVAGWPGVAYRHFDLTDAGPDRLGEILGRVVELVRTGTLEPLPYRAFGVREAVAAFRHMASAGHVGKIVLTAAGPVGLDPGASYLVTGGLGGLGLAAARWLARQGARHIVLVGRSRPHGDAAAAVSGLRAAGVRVDVRAVDVSKRSVVDGLVADLPDLRGILHCAGVLADAVLLEQDWDRVDRVAAPKLDGARHLADATDHRRLDFFVLYSSIAALLGSPGQANYAAVNAGLDALAAARRARGLPGVSVGWGAFAGVGMAAADPTRAAMLTGRGFTGMTAGRGTDALAAVLAGGSGYAAVAALDPARWAARHPAIAALPVHEFAHPYRLGPAPSPPEYATATAADLTADERVAVLAELVGRQVATVLQRPGPVDPGRPLRELGVDSLTGLELRNLLSARLSTPLAATLMFDHPTVDDIAGHLAATVPADRIPLPAAGSPPPPPPVAAPVAPPVAAPVAAPAPSTSDGRRADEPIAVIGMACRFPGGVRTPDQLWSLLVEGRDAITEVPPDRWDIDAYFSANPDVPGTMYTRWGGFVDDIDMFDPAFFNLAPREAAAVDPQQRLLLEVAWEALERAGYAPMGRAGTDTGVFVGLCTSEHAAQTLLAADPADIDAYTVTGATPSVASGRVAYVLGLRGPAMTVDTACSSSLVSLHLAVESLRGGGCDLALAGGVNLQLVPQTTISFCRLRALSPTGRSRAFSAGADGYVRGDGCGIVVLKRLSDAERDGDEVLAVVRGTAVNHDGRSNGLTAPSRPAQEAVLRRALTGAGTEPASVGYVEAHGTGTPLGDPIEVAALSAVYGPGRTGPLLVGSIKTNIGHTEGAAGVAGLMKAVLAVRTGVIPPSLHFDAPNPHVPWDQVPVSVVTDLRPWPHAPGPRRAAVSSFGISGTNAHVVIEQAPARSTATPSGAAEPTVRVLPVSGHDEATVVAQAGAIATWLDEHREADLAAVARTLGTGRTHFENRLAVTASSADQARERLAAYAAGAGRDGPDGCHAGERDERAPQIAVLFTGQGSQYPGMARDLFGTEPVFRAQLLRCDEILGDIHNGHRLLDVVHGDAGAALLDETVFTQPALFAVEWSLWTLLRDWGIAPAAALGHSVGEFVAACAAGVLDPDDALRLVAERARLMYRLPRDGAMVSVRAGAALVEPLVARYPDEVSIAAYNAPNQVVISGARARVEQLSAELRGAGAVAVPLAVSHAFHSPLLAPMLDDLTRAATGIPTRAPEIAMISNVTGERVRGGDLTPQYWARHARSAVRFAPGMAALHRLGIDVYVEIGPNPVLSTLGRASVPDGRLFLPTLRRGRGDRESVMDTVARLYAAGADLNWARLAASDGPRADLPTYPFQRSRLVRRGRQSAPVTATAPSAPAAVMPATPAAVMPAAPGPVGVEDRARAVPDASFADHVVHGVAVAPATYFMTALLGHAESVTGMPVALRDLVFTRPLSLSPPPPDAATVLRARAGGGYDARFVSTGPGGTAIPHAVAVAEPSAVMPEPEAVDAILARCPQPVSAADLYDLAARAGLAYGPAFRRVTAVRRGDGEAMARVGTGNIGAAGDSGAARDPSVLDACLHVLLTLTDPVDGALAWVPVGADAVRWAPGDGVPADGTPVWSHARVVSRAPDRVAADVRVLTAGSRVLVEITGLRLAAVSAAELLGVAVVAPLSPAAPGPARAAVGNLGADVESAIRRVLGLGPDADLGLPLHELGLESIGAQELRSELSRMTGLALPVTVAYDHPSAAAVTAHLAGLLSAAAPPVVAPAPSTALPSTALPSTAPAPPPAPPAAVVRARPEPEAQAGPFDVAIVGISGRYPGAASHAALWTVLSEGRDCITEIPPDRWRHDGYYDPARRRPGAAYSKWGGFLADVDAFDPQFFSISPREAELMDPQERLFLETAWSALEDAGHTPASLRRSGVDPADIGVYVGVMWQTYHLFGADPARLGRTELPVSSHWSIANRVSYLLDFQGPSIAVDTACSSSLTALHLACESLRTGDCRVALAGGVNLTVHPYKYLALSQSGFVSSDGRCRAFGAGGDGYVPGEGVGAVLLRPLRDAERDGDHIYGVVKGTAVNHGGHATGYTVPNPRAQAAVIAKALRRADVEPASIGYVEAHGTGTGLGDPIEIAALSQVFGPHVTPGACPIGSVKSNVGHLESAAGMVSLAKVLLQLEHGHIAPSLHADPPNPGIDFAASPFHVVRELTPWQPDGPLPRRACISSFGAGGANAHVVVEEHVPATVAPASGPDLVTLSARTPERLREQAANLVSRLDRRPPPLADVAHTLRTGREPMRHRLAVVATDAADLSAKLTAWLRPDGGEDSGVRAGQRDGVPMLRWDDEDDRQYLRALARSGRLDRLAGLWAGGCDIDWDDALPPATRHRVPLPTYPFARERYWVPDTAPFTAPDMAPDTVAEAPTVPVHNGPDRRILVAGWRAEPADATPAAARTVLLLHDGDGAGYLPALRAPFGADVEAVVAPTDFEAGAALGRAVAGRDRRPDVVLDLDHGAADVGRLGFYQGLVDARGTGDLVLVHAGSGAAPSVVAGLLPALAAEYRGVAARTVDVGARPDPAALAAWLAAEASDRRSVRVRYRDGRREVPVLTPATGTAALAVDPDRAYVVTGGTRGLGAAFAAMLVDRGARRVALLGIAPLPDRAGWPALAAAPDPDARVRHVLDLEARGATVLVHTGPLTDRDAVGAFLDRVRRDLGPIAGVLHCAGAVSGESPAYVHKSRAGIARVLEPKVDGTVALAGLLDADRPDFVVLFSSVAGTAPGLAAGLADYAAANAYLDRFAEDRHRRGQTWYRSLAWPSFAGTGFGAVASAAYRNSGLGHLSVADGYALLAEALSIPDAPVVVPIVAGPGFDADALLRLPAAAPVRAVGDSRERATAATAAVVRILSAELKLAPDRFRGDARFDEYGADSVLIASAARRLDEIVGAPVDPGLLLEHPTVDSLAGYLAARYPDRFGDTEPAEAQPAQAAQPAQPAQAAEPAQAIVAAAEPRPSDAAAAIAVVGIGVRFPGGEDVEAFWSSLVESHCAVREVPADRWDADRWYGREPGPGRTVSRWGGFLDGIDLFDPAYFRIDEAHAAEVDPLQRLALETVAAAVRDAGYPEQSLAGQRVGVYLGSRVANYAERVPQAGRGTIIGTGQNFIAARVADFLDVRGPNLVVDTACSSSLVSIHLACQALRAGEVDAALAGGSEVLLDELPFLALSAAGALSPDGVCRTFDESANGFVPGEGAGAVVLKRLDDAVRDGDRIRAVIRGSAVNNDGRTMGITTPNPLLQVDVIEEALRRAGLRATDLSYVEAHGTATMIGDPIELRALATVFDRHGARPGACAIGSVKTNIGHLLSAAGVAGLVKTALALERGVLPASLHCATPNPRFAFDGSPFRVVRQTTPWLTGAGVPRRAGVSSFGFGGTNCHVVLEAFDGSGAGASIRRPLPPPVFRRRRFFLDRRVDTVDGADDRPLLQFEAVP